MLDIDSNGSEQNHTHIKLSRGVNVNVAPLTVILRELDVKLSDKILTAVENKTTTFDQETKIASPTPAVLPRYFVAQPQDVDAIEPVRCFGHLNFGRRRHLASECLS
jgi:hypothetical protein